MNFLGATFFFVALLIVTAREAQDKRNSGTVYVVEVTTGDVVNAGTHADVFISITGSEAMLPKSELENLNHDDFERGNTDKFEITAAHLGGLSKLKVEHDNKNSNPDWFLDKITVYERENPNHRWRFPGNNWLSKNTQLSRILNVKESVYVVEVTTGDVVNAGTHADVFISITGSEAMLPKSELENLNHNDFERGNTDKFEITAVHLGGLSKLKAEHDNRNSNPDWFLDKIVVYERDNPAAKWTFLCNQWLSTQAPDGSHLSRELTAVAGR